MGNPEDVTWTDIKPLTIKEPGVTKGWKQLSKHEPSFFTHMSDPGDVFQQLFYAFDFLRNSSPESKHVDVSYLQYLVSSRGDEMSGDLFEEFLKAMGHPVKGHFDVVLFMQVYLKYAMKAGLFAEEEIERAKATIQLAHEKFGKKPMKRGSMKVAVGMMGAARNIGLEQLASNAVGEEETSELSEEAGGKVRRRQSLFPMSGRPSQIGRNSESQG
jgi:hypothetical protein